MDDMSTGCNKVTGIALAGLENDRLARGQVRIIVPAVRWVRCEQVVGKAPFGRAVERVEDRVAVDQIPGRDRGPGA